MSQLNTTQLLGIIISNRYFEVIFNPQKGTFTNPWETWIEFDRFRWTNRFEFDRSMEMREIGYGYTYKRIDIPGCND